MLSLLPFFQAALKLMFNKIRHSDYRQTLQGLYQAFSLAEQQLLADILHQYEFDASQEQALIQAALQQSRFDPNATHLAFCEDDEDTTGVCPHCINPPIPPLRDYLMWRQSKG